MGDFNDKKTEKSQFNEANLQIMRLHNCWVRCNSYSTKGKLDEWKWELDVIWRELYADAFRKDKKCKKDEDKYEFDMDNINVTISNAKSKRNAYNALQKKDMFLRKLQDDVGKGGKREKGYAADLMS